MKPVPTSKLELLDEFQAVLKYPARTFPYMAYRYRVVEAALRIADNQDMHTLCLEWLAAHPLVLSGDQVHSTVRTIPSAMRLRVISGGGV